jgi:hypothetical protein
MDLRLSRVRCNRDCKQEKKRIALSHAEKDLDRMCESAHLDVDQSPMSLFSSPSPQCSTPNNQQTSACVTLQDPPAREKERKEKKRKEKKEKKKNKQTNKQTNKQKKRKGSAGPRPRVSS